jgi:succinate dehydrogenase / fumarate reductase iron-sulfur subunit
MNLTLKVWRQKNANTPGRFETYQARNVIPDMSFLEMLDVVNEDLISRGEDPIAFDSDCREGICGMCSLVISGIPHGGHKGTASCQLHLRHFKDGDSNRGGRRPFQSSRTWSPTAAPSTASSRPVGLSP